MYELVRNELKKHGIRGLDLDTVLENTGLTRDQLYQTLGPGLHKYGIESFSVDGVTWLRNRPSNSQLWKKNYSN